MAIIKKRKIFPKDAEHPQQYLSKYNRLGVISAVDVEAGTCVVRWLDNPGGRTNVALTQGSWGEYNMPIVDAIVYVQFDQYDRAKIVRYANLNQALRQKLPSEDGLGELPKIQVGEKYWESGDGKTGAYIYMTQDGKIYLVDAHNNNIEINPNSDLIRMETVNWKVISNAGDDYFGEIKRWLPNGVYTTITDNIPTPAYPLGTPLTERHITITDFNNKTLNTGVNTIKINIGTYVDDFGNVLNAAGASTFPVSTDAIAFRLEIIPTVGASMILTVDKGGKIGLTTPHFTLNSTQIQLGDLLATDPAVLGNELVSILNAIVTAFNSHTHTGGTIFGLTGIPTTPLVPPTPIPSILSKNVTLK